MKQFLDKCRHDSEFIRETISSCGLRIDGRGLNEYRDLSIKLSRKESTSHCEVRIGSSWFLASVKGDVVSPYLDRPNEGILQFNAEISMGAVNAGIKQAEITRLLERSIRESDTIDTESLCIVGGKSVWMITCNVSILDYSGAAVDGCVLSAMGALRAFRKPDAAVVHKSDLINSNGSVTVTVFHSDEREPLPLALHHTPLSVTIGLFRTASSNSQSSSSCKDNSILLEDPSSEEDDVLDGRILFSINAHRELCAIYKPGGVAVSPDIVIAASRLAAIRAATLHARLTDALTELEVQVQSEREERLRLLKAQRAVALAQQQQRPHIDVLNRSDSSNMSSVSISRDDPLLSWGLLHQSVGVSEL